METTSGRTQRRVRIFSWRDLSCVDLLVMGSGALVGSLIRHDLVDDYVLLIHPLVLGSGRRLFPDHGAFAALRLVDAQPTTTGVVIATYRQAERTAGTIN